MRMVSRNRERKGFSYVTAIILLFLAAAAYAGYVFVPVYKADWDFKREAELMMIQASETPDAKIQEHLNSKAADLHIPLDAGSLEVARAGNEITIAYQYDREVKFPLINTLHFQEKMTKEIKPIIHLQHQK